MEDVESLGGIALLEEVHCWGTLREFIASALCLLLKCDLSASFPGFLLPYPPTTIIDSPSEPLAKINYLWSWYFIIALKSH